LEGSLVAALLRAEVDGIVIHCPAVPARTLAVLRIAEVRAVAFENGSIVAIIVALGEGEGELHSGLAENGGAIERRSILYIGIS